MSPSSTPTVDLVRRRHAAERAMRRLERLEHARERRAVRDWVQAARAGTAPWEPDARLGARRATARLELAHHAVARWCQRVDRTATHEEAEDALAAFVDRAVRRPTPRHWMARGRTAEPGTTYLYAHDLPGVCAVAVEGTVVTVVTRRR